MKRKLISLFLIMTLVLTACGNDVKPDAETIENKTDTIEDKPAAEEKSDGSWAIYWYLCGSDLESKYKVATDNLKEILDAKGSDKVNVLVCAERTRHERLCPQS